jgi:hypothetical protein
VINLPALRGYLLEEVLAWLLKTSGYELLAVGDDSPDVLDQTSHGLVVRGRGAWHQADALGEFRHVPPFSLPVRLFLEAKFTRAKVGLGVVRNGHGVVHDVNENVVSSPRSAAGGPYRPRTRYRYNYAIFATRGFSREAQEYALAHQISLIDLSMPSFQPLRTLVETTVMEVHAGLDGTWPGQPPLVHTLREIFRGALEGVSATDSLLPDRAARPLQAMAETLRSRTGLGLVLAFPPAPFVLGLVPDDVSAFERYALRYPTHTVRLRRTDRRGAHPTWVVHPAQRPEAYAMAFGLPEQVEAWILDQDESVRSRTRWVKNRLLSAMTIYWLGDDHAHTFHLRYEPGELREGRTAR